MRVRQKLFLVLVLTALIPLLFLLFFVVDRVERELEARTSEELHKTLAKMSQELQTLMDTQKALVQGLAKVPVVREFAEITEIEDPLAYDSKANELAAFFLNYQATLPSIQALRYTDLNGKTLVKVKEGSLIPNKLGGGTRRGFVEDIAVRPFFQYAKNTKEDISVSDFERGKVAGEVDFCPAMVRYSSPIRDELDTLKGILIVNMWGRRVDSAVEAALGGYPGKAYIVELNDQNPERDGIYLYHQDQDRRFSNQLGTNYRLSTEIGPEKWAAIKSSGIKGRTHLDSDDILFFRKYSPYTDRSNQWLLIIETARETILSPVKQLRNWIAVLIGVAFVLSLVIAHRVAVRMSKPVQELTGILTRYADGDYTVRYTDDRKDEIGSVGKAFNYLSNNLEQAKQERNKAENAVRQSERLAATGQLAAGIGHEINNPLMNIMSLAGLIDESLGEKDQQIKEDIKALQREGRRCARVVQGILNFARKTEPSYTCFDLVDLVEESVSLLNHRMSSAMITPKVVCDRPLMIDGDYNQLQQVLVNVLLNAIQASPANTQIDILAHAQDNQVSLVIRDQGRGIEAHDMSKIFNPFFSTKPEGTGTGLGLSVSYGIIQQHQGTISISNRSNGQSGVSVQIVLPSHNMSEPEMTGENEVEYEK